MAHYDRRKVGNVKGSRREFLRGAYASSIILLASACAPSASPAPTASSSGATKPAPTSAGGAKSAEPTAAPSKPAWESQWDQWVADARKEGSLVMNVYPGDQEAQAYREFEKAFPGITLEMTRLVANEHTPRVLQEIKAGIFTWDIGMLPASSPSLIDMKAAGVWDPIRPELIRPDVTDDQNWVDGFDAGWMDSEKQYAYASAKNVRINIWFDSSVVGPEEIKSAKDLVDPKWKGKMVWTDPRSSGFSWTPLTVMRLRNGDEIVQQLMVDQEPVIVRDPRQATEFLVRGRYPIAVGSTKEVLDDFKKEGLGASIKDARIPDGIYVNHIRQPFLHKNAPHPNAAKVFANWLLGPDGQRAWATFFGTNSRRKDTPPGDPDTIPEPGKDYWVSDSEQGIKDVVRTQELAREVIRI
jgi:iron(III) transport system substrate-binding protein